MYLVLGQLEMAEQRLAALDQVCNASCFEYGMLKKAIDDYKANGNKYVQAAP